MLSHYTPVQSHYRLAKRVEWRSDKVGGRRIWTGAEITSRHYPATIVWTEVLYYVQQ